MIKRWKNNAMDKCKDQGKGELTALVSTMFIV